MANITVPKAGGRIKISGVSSPTAHTITVGDLPSYATLSTSGNSKVITFAENTYTARTFTLTATGVTASDPSYQGTATITSSWTVTQAGNSINITSTTPIAATATTMSYTVTATNNCRVRLSGGQIPTFVQRDHSSGTSTGSFTISANTETYELYYTLDAWILENTSVEKVLSLTQAGAAPKYVTGITVSNVNQVTDIPYTGGTATYQNFSYTVTLHYNDGTTSDITSTADMSDSTTVSAGTTTNPNRHSVGVINITAVYYDGPNPFSSTVAAYCYQAGAPSQNIHLQWITGQFQNNTQNYAGVSTNDTYVTCSYGTEGTSFTTRGTVASHSTGDLYVGAETGYEVPPETVSFTIDGFPSNIVPIPYDNCYITIYFSQGTTTRSISYSTTAPTILTQSVDFSEFNNSSDVNVRMTINFVKT